MKCLKFSVENHSSGTISPNAIFKMEKGFILGTKVHQLFATLGYHKKRTATIF